ncbi:MAG TPA: hypothetical protein VIN10_06780 [Bacteroidales bacterium]
MATSLSGQNILKVNKKEIKCGDTIQVFFENKYSGNQIKIIDPLGNEFIIDPVKDSEGSSVSFVTDETRGFLTDDWNKYSIYLVNNSKLIDSTFVRLADSEKILYFTIFIDDVGPYGYINEEDYNWFKSKGGKFNIGYMQDDFGMDDLSFVLNKYSDPTDFIFHHFHAQRFSGNQTLLKIYQFTRWKDFKTSIGDILGIELRDRHFILAGFGFSLLVLLLIFIISKKNATRIAGLVIIILLNLILFGIIYTYSYVIDVDKKEVMLSNTEWCKTFLENKKGEFDKNGMPYPQITRHGWTVPPRGLGEFYLLEMGVLADQSLEYTPFLEKDFYQQDHGTELNNVFDYHVYTWPEDLRFPIPFYTNMNGDINQLWDGNEARRGIIEIPSSHGPYATQPYDERSLKLCDSLPNGALVSCWGHPGRRMENAKPLLDYVEKNFQIQLVNVKEYLDVFMANNPRPVIIDTENKQAFWAYVGNGKFEKIVSCDLVSFETNDYLANFKNDPPILVLNNNADTTAITSRYHLEKTESNVFIFKLKK